MDKLSHKALTEQEQAIEDFVTQECKTAYTVNFTGTQKRDKWECDGWRFTLAGQEFEYYTGTGNRVDNAEAKFQRKHLAKTNRNSVAWHEGVIKNQVAVIPAIAGLLYCVISDMDAVAQSFDDWCVELDYDTDSRKALDTYLACQEDATKLRKVFNQEQIGKLQELLQDY